MCIVVLRRKDSFTSLREKLGQAALANPLIVGGRFAGTEVS